MYGDKHQFTTVPLQIPSVSYGRGCLECRSICDVRPALRCNAPWARDADRELDTLAVRVRLGGCPRGEKEHMEKREVSSCPNPKSERQGWRLRPLEEAVNRRARTDSKRRVDDSR